MVEVVTFAPEPPYRQAFSASLRSAIGILQAAPGYQAHVIGCGIEEPGTLLLLVWWTSLEAHVRDFRGTAAHQAWRARLATYLRADPMVRHYDLNGFPSGSPGEPPVHVFSATHP